jgi:hypothetical protein
MSGIEQIPEDSRLRGYDYTGSVFRYVSVNASGVMKTDIEVEISSGLIMPGMAVLSGQVAVLSGQISVSSGFVAVLSGNITATISGQPVTISGDHVYVESGVYIASGAYVTADITESGMGVTIQSGAGVVLQSGGAVNLYGYHPASGIWRPLVCDLSGCLAVTWATSGGIWS